MKLEEAIKQTKFKNEHHKMLINIIYTSNFLKAKNSCSIKKYGITSEQFNVLRILRGQYPNAATVNTITERMLDKSSNASRLVEKLRVKKLLERATCEEDRRSVNVVITKKGLDLLAEMDKEEAKWLKEIQNITEDEALQLNFLLDKLRE